MKKILLAMVLVSSVASANEFLITQDQAKSASSKHFSLDFVSSGDAVDLVARINIPDVDSAKVDYSGCGKGKPEGFESVCSVAKGMLIVQLIGDGTKRLPKGQVSMGVFSVSYSDGKSRSLSFAENDVSSASAVVLEAKTNIQ